MQEAAACSRARTTSRPFAHRKRTSTPPCARFWSRSSSAVRPAAPVLVDIALPGGTVLVGDVTGTGFLRHMVRAIVGTLVRSARVMAPANLRALLDRGRRDAAGPTAPAAGLCLARVDYGEARRRLRLSVNSL